ncbi:hypothetical protein [Inmirania thermothiophila]|uniref:NAD(P)-binding protein n=1 Tax=Inmirania thermothiophila TaxID=1750597 RepID=A0A3N1Y706_9GAMM|nr:hypothetical protein [Inmirania thermothiophila]ROR34609.1 hypothetical protein EDC57_0508 [Inmirania thermothiophila]
MRRFLVIGATGVAGGAAIRAVRRFFGEEAEVTGVWYGRPGSVEAVEGVDRLVFGDAAEPQTLEAVAREAGERFDWCFFATAMGEVGFPIREATPEQIAQSNRLSFDPLPRIEQRFEVGTLVAYSTFFTLRHQRITYGAMGHSKHAIEQWAVQPGRSRHLVIRAGAFRSASSQAIKLLVRRRARQLAQAEDPLLRSYFEGTSPAEAVERLERAVLEEERATYGDTGTDAAALEAAHVHLFNGVHGPFVNVCGRRIWESAEPQPLPTE